MFWSLVIPAGKVYHQKTECSFHISHATLGSISDDQGTLTLKNQETGSWINLCHLNKNQVQVPLDLNFENEEEVSFKFVGKGSAHLSGYVILDDGGEDSDLDDSDFMANGMNSTLDSSMFDEGDDDDSEEEEGDDSSPAAKIVEAADALKKKRKLAESPKVAHKKMKIDDKESPKESKKAEPESKKAAPPKTIMDMKLNEDDSDDDWEDEEEDGEDDDDEDEEESKEGEDSEDEEESGGDDEDEDMSSFAEMLKRKLKEKAGGTPDKKKTADEGKGIPQKQQSGKKAEKPAANEDMSNKRRSVVNTNGNSAHDSSAEVSENSSPTLTKSQKKRQKQLAKLKEGNQESPAGTGSPRTEVKGGVKITHLKNGNGPVAKSGKFVHVYYTGKLKKNGQVFDTQVDGKGFKFRLGSGEVIQGWDRGIEGMKVGDKRRIEIPPALAYGHKGAPPDIPPNSDLIFDVELKAVS